MFYFFQSFSNFNRLIKLIVTTNFADNLTKNCEIAIDRSEAWLNMKIRNSVPSSRFSALLLPLSRSFHWCRMHNVHRGFVCPTSCDLRCAGHRPPRDSPTHPPAQGIKNTHKLAMFDVGPLTGCIPAAAMRRIYESRDNKKERSPEK